MSSATSGIGVSERDSSDKESYGDTSGQTPPADLRDDDDQGHRQGDLQDDDAQGHLRKQDHNWNNETQTDEFVHKVDYSENYRAR